MKTVQESRKNSQSRGDEVINGHIKTTMLLCLALLKDGENTKECATKVLHLGNQARKAGLTRPPEYYEYIESCIEKYMDSWADSPTKTEGLYKAFNLIEKTSDRLGNLILYSVIMEAFNVGFLTGKKLEYYKKIDVKGYYKNVHEKRVYLKSIRIRSKQNITPTINTECIIEEEMGDIFNFGLYLGYIKNKNTINKTTNRKNLAQAVGISVESATKFDNTNQLSNRYLNKTLEELMESPNVRCWLKELVIKILAPFTVATSTEPN